MGTYPFITSSIFDEKGIFIGTQRTCFLTPYEGGKTRRPLFYFKDSISLDFSYQPGVKNLLFMYLCTRNCLLAVT